MSVIFKMFIFHKKMKIKTNKIFFIFGRGPDKV